jgi:hypothetical protein
VYRLWRDLGYAIGALLAGVTADLFGLEAALWVIAALTFASGGLAAARLTETLAAPARVSRSNSGERRPQTSGARRLTAEADRPE